MSWTPALLIPLRQALRDLILLGDAPPALRLHRADATLLATLPLHSLEVDEHGALILHPGAAETDCPASGLIAYAELLNGEGIVIATGIPVTQGTTATPGTVVLSHMTAVQGGRVELLSARIE